MAITSPARSAYLLVCRGASRPVRSPAEMGALLHQWLEWHDSLQAAGRLRFCSPFESKSRAISGRLSAIAHGEREEEQALVGSLLVEAESFSDATEVAQGCPGLPHGFVIEIYQPIE